jgi:hypothetical protein
LKPRKKLIESNLDLVEPLLEEYINTYAIGWRRREMTDGTSTKM